MTDFQDLFFNFLNKVKKNNLKVLNVANSSPKIVEFKSEPAVTF